MEMEREMEREGDGEGEKGRMCRWLLSQGGFFSSSKPELQQRGFCWWMRSATIHEERESQCVIPLFSSWYNQKKHSQKFSIVTLFRWKSADSAGEENWVYSWIESKGRETRRQGHRGCWDWHSPLRDTILLFFEDRTLALTGDTTYTVRVEWTVLLLLHGLTWFSLSFFIWPCLQDHRAQTRNISGFGEFSPPPFLLLARYYSGMNKYHHIRGLVDMMMMIYDT